MPLPYVITVSSEKGGVGKTTIATNLAIYLKALAEDLPVTLLSFDNHFSVDRMFRIGTGEGNGSVGDLFSGQPLATLTEMGQFGVQFIPSNRTLPRLREHIASAGVLAQVLAASDLSGVVIIDTRPDLDIFTRNALFAADRVIVPVKDTPSLENCRNLYEFFEQEGLSRRPLRLLPCLVDSRVSFSGPFKDPYQLLKAFAINRGYRCMEGFIAKSPKVDSLNTNPEGKIYPILTHGRNTEVHVQFAHLARQIFLDLRETTSRRLDQIVGETTRKLREREATYRLRRSRLAPTCLLCGQSMVAGDQIAPAGYYWETGGGDAAGFLEDHCFSTTVFRHVFNATREPNDDDPLRHLFRESAQRCFFVLCQTPETRSHFRQQLAFYRFDEDGLLLSRKVIEHRDQPVPDGEKPCALSLLLSATIEAGSRLGNDFLLIRRVDSDFPEEILFEQNHAALRLAAAKIAKQLR